MVAPEECEAWEVVQLAVEEREVSEVVQSAAEEPGVLQGAVQVVVETVEARVAQAETAVRAVGTVVIRPSKAPSRCRSCNCLRSTARFLPRPARLPGRSYRSIVPRRCPGRHRDGACRHAADDAHLIHAIVAGGVAGALYAAAYDSTRTRGGELLLQHSGTKP
eukprot:7191675-Prymnesium_polylepis.2